jgi:predicted kinase
MTGTLIIIAGLPASGKTTLARQMEADREAVRLCPDEWSESLEIIVTSEMSARFEQLQWKFAQRLLFFGVTVIIEWGTYLCSERDLLRKGARVLGSRVELYVLDPPPQVLLDRYRARGNLHIDRRYVEQLCATFERPDPQELALYD